MNFLSIFVLIPLVMLLALWLVKGQNAIRTVMAIGSTALLALAVYLTVIFLADRAAGADADDGGIQQGEPETARDGAFQL